LLQRNHYKHMPIINISVPTAVSLWDAE
jgi:hypothetical protein